MANEAVDWATGRLALEQYEERIAATEPIDLRGLDMRRAALAGVAVARGIEADGLRPRFARLDGEAWSIQSLDDLLPLSLATLALLQAIVAAAGESSSTRVDPDLVDQARTLRERMLSVLEYHCGDYPRTLEHCADIRRGSGYYDLISDLDRLRSLYARHEADLRDDRKKYDPADAVRADTLAGNLLDAITSADTPEQKRLKAKLARLGALLKHAYEETGSAGRFILRHQDGAERFPETLRALARR